MPRPQMEGRIGLELEFAGLDEAETAKTIAAATGGEARQKDALTWTCTTDLFGQIEVYLDTQYKDKVAELGGARALNVLRTVVPVEVVTEPFDLVHLPEFEAVTRALRDGGAKGSGDGLFFGFGLHLNIEVPEVSAAHIAPRLAAFALLEDLLRARDPIDISRRVLPFVAPYPDTLVNALAENVPQTVGDLTDLYLTHAPSRDHGLDLLPVLAEHDGPRVRDAAEGYAKIKSRPAFHFRLPDCRIDEESWSVLHAWEQWALVDGLARDGDALDAIRGARRAWLTENRLTRPPWFRRAQDVLRSFDLEGAA